MRYQGTRGDGLPTVGDVGRALSADVAALVETPLGEPSRISGITFFDFHGQPRHLPGAIAFLIGAVPVGIEVSTLFDQLRDAGYSGVVYKTYGRGDTELREASRRAGIAAFRAADHLPWEQLADFFRTAIVATNKSSHLLIDICPGDLFEFANAVASLTGGAIAIADPGQTVLAYSTLPEQPIDETRRASILYLRVPRTAQTDQDYRRVHAAREVVAVAPEKNSLSRFAVAIRAGDVVLGSLWFIAANPADRDTEKILVEASNVAAMHLLYRRTHHDAERARTMELVKPLLFDRDRAEPAAIQLGLLTGEVRVAAFSAGAATYSAPETLRLSMMLFDIVRKDCTVKLPGAICGFSDNVVYIVLPHSGSSWPLFQRAAILRIAHHARRVLDRPILAGLGSKQPIAGAARSRADAEAVLAMLLQDVDDGRIAADSDEIVGDSELLGARLQLRYVFNALKEAGQLPGEIATRIADHDKRHKTSYEVTIRTFLDCNSNTIETAARLGVHANSVRYRLARVGPLFDINLDSPETRLLVWLQLSANQL